MGKRIIILCSDVTGKYNFNYFGLGLPTDIIKVLRKPDKNSMPVAASPEDEQLFRSLGPGDGVILGDSESFSYLRQFYHFGIRNENFTDCCQLKRLSIEGGAFVKCIESNKPGIEDLQYFMSDSFVEEVKYNFKHKILHNVKDSMVMLDYFDSLPIDTHFGFDYEASGMALDKQFEISGASLCTTSFGGFISFTDCRHNNTKEEYDQLLKRLGRFLVKRQDHVWVYNMQYEFQVSHRMLGVSLYNLCDASTINVLDGHHLNKKYSLKWTAQRVLGVNVWDTEFDRISDLVDEMLFETVGKLKADKRVVLKVTKDNFKSTPQWKLLCDRCRGYEKELESLILEYWGNAFMCIPSDILGHYCNLDAFYTLMLYEAKKNEYSEDAFRTFLDNSRLGSLLHSSGLYIDEDYRLKYEAECLKMMAWGITYCATARCKIRMNLHAPKMAKIEKFHPAFQTLIKNGNSFKADPVEITKFILLDNLDTIQAYESGIDEGKLMMTYGDAFAGDFLDIVKNAAAEVKLKDAINETIVRKKKFIGIVASKLKVLLGLDKINSLPKLEELEMYSQYERAFIELSKVSKQQLNDVTNIPEKIYAFGNWFSLEEYSKYISDNYFKCKSPEENNLICHEFADLFKAETAFLAAIMDSTQQLKNAENFYVNLGIDNISDAFSHFMNSWEQYVKGSTLGDYPQKVYELASTYFGSIKAHNGTKSVGGKDVPCVIIEDHDRVKDMWSDFDGYNAQSQFFKNTDSQYDSYTRPFDVADLSNNTFDFMRKMVINYLLYKKYSKVLSTYINGLFKASNKWVIEGEDKIPLRYADQNEPGAVEKCFCHYEVNTKSSKRWSSGFHTIISHSDLKDCIAAPEGYVMTYFDISSAEVKSAGYASKDPGLISKFNSGEDIYIYSAKLYLGDHWDELDKKQKKMWRKRFKTVFLGVLYGLGKKSLAERLNASEEDAEDIIQGLYKSFPKLREYIADQKNYVMSNGGYINTMLGDKLKVQEWKLFEQVTSSREKQNLKARIERLGVNLPIQGGTSSIMASGFFNNLRLSNSSPLWDNYISDPSTIEGWNNNRGLKPIIVVHDSNTNYVPIEKIFDIRKFYDENYTNYCASFGPKIRLLFDLMCGDAYERSMEMKNLDEDTIQFSGSAYSMRRIYEKIMNCDKFKVECDTKLEDLAPNFVEHPVHRFILERGTCMIKDLSNYTVTFRRIRG